MKLVKNLVITCFLISLFAIPLSAQDDANFELQVYPTGIIPGIRLEKNFAQHHAAHIRVGAQFINHRGYGKQEKEKGYGYGTSFGYKRYFSGNFKGVSLGLKCDLWQNFIRWRNLINTPAESSGKTEIYVIQPTVELGYTILKKSNLLITPTCAVGFEWNVKTEGQPTGEGAIILFGVLIGKRNFNT